MGVSVASDAEVVSLIWVLLRRGATERILSEMLVGIDLL